MSNYIKQLSAYLKQVYALKEIYIPVIFRMNQLCSKKEKDVTLRSTFCNKCKIVISKEESSMQQRKSINKSRSSCCKRILKYDN